MKLTHCVMKTANAVDTFPLRNILNKIAEHADNNADANANNSAIKDSLIKFLIINFKIYTCAKMEN